tara:strand:- start:207 stop:368 length:162 start_codon:yes stop_codon:yes gene_type:complete
VKFALSSEQVSSVLVGNDRLEYLEYSIGVADGNCLNHELLMQVKELEYPVIDF